MPSALVSPPLGCVLAERRSKLYRYPRAHHSACLVATLSRLVKRLERLESKAAPTYSSLEEIPSPVLEVMVRYALQEGNHTPEEEEMCRRLQQCGFVF